MTRDAVKRLRGLLLDAEGSIAASDPSAVRDVVVSMRAEVVNVSSRHGEFRQLFDIGLSDTATRLEGGDLPAAQTSIDTLRILLGSLEETAANG